MKKILLSILAIAAIVSCSKSDVTYDEPSEIGISPVAENRTKAMFTGNMFDASMKFNVWAYHKQVEAGTDVDNFTDAQNYINESTFVNKEGTQWGGETSKYYWPKQGSLVFVGYYPVSEKNIIDYDIANLKMTIGTTEKPYSPNTVNNNTTEDWSEDLMYFNITSKSHDNNGATGVPVTFKHALAWITVNVKKEGDANIVLDKFSFRDVCQSGTAVVENQQDIVWTPIELSKAEELVLTNQVLTTQFVKATNEPLFIPQTAATKTIFIQYTVGNEGETFTETLEIDPSAILTADNSAIASWLPGKHYTYNVTIGTEEILIQPNVTVWEEAKQDITVQ